MDKVAAVTGRQYHPFDYVGAPDATGRYRCYRFRLVKTIEENLSHT